jgi:hypothetical protein
MKYIIAVVVCAAEFLLYILIGIFLGWKHGGGNIPMMILFSILGATWVAITKHEIEKTSAIKNTEANQKKDEDMDNTETI